MGCECSIRTYDLCPCIQTIKTKKLKLLNLNITKFLLTTNILRSSLILQIVGEAILTILKVQEPPVVTTALSKPPLVADGDAHTVLFTLDLLLQPCTTSVYIYFELIVFWMIHIINQIIINK